MMILERDAKRLLAIAALLSALGAAAVPVQAYGVAVDFDDYNLGAVSGQFGWLNDRLPLSETTGGYIEASVVDDPTQSHRGRVLSLFHEGWRTYWTGAYLPTDGWVLDEIGRICLSWHQYRTDLVGYVSVSEHPDYENWSSNQLCSSMFAGGLSGPSGTLTAGVWQWVRIEIDVVARTASGYLDGEHFATVSDVLVDQFRGIDFQIASLNGGRTEDLYIDNISITATVPEPGSFAVLAIGLGGVAGITRVRKKTRTANTLGNKSEE